MLDCIKNIDNFALTGSTSIYGEDTVTAQQLLIKSAKKVKECVNVCEKLYENNYTVITQELTYNAEQEELAIKSIKLSLTNASAYVQRFFYLFNENSKSPIELAGNINSAINECLTVIENTCKGLTGDSIKTLLAELDGLYVDIYEDCPMTLLELAGKTAKNVNGLVSTINQLEVIINTLVISYSEDTESLNALTGVEDENVIL